MYSNNVSQNHSRKGLASWVAILLFVAAVVVFSPATAHADSDVDYTVSGTFASGGTLSGTFTLDTTTDTITSADLTADGANFSCPDSDSNGCILYTTLDNGASAGFLSGQNSSQYLFLEWSNTADPSGFALTTASYGVSLGSYCEGCAPSSSQDFLVSGEAIDPSDGDSTATPEPGTWLLLLSGILGMGFLGLRRRGSVNALAS